MPSEKLQHLFRAPSSTAILEREETLSVLGSQGSSFAVELLWRRSENDESLRRQLTVIVLRSRLKPVPNEEQIREYLGHLCDLSKFSAEWRESDSGWAAFLAEVVTSIESLLNQCSLTLIKPQLEEIIDTAELSSSIMDDCFSCGLEIDRLRAILLPNHGGEGDKES